jgi:hypothetical protein
MLPGTLFPDLETFPPQQSNTGPIDAMWIGGRLPLDMYPHKESLSGGAHDMFCLEPAISASRDEPQPVASL